MKRTAIALAVASFAVAALSGAAVAEGLKIGQDETALTQTRISNAGGGAAGNPHWGSEPHQSPWSEEEDINDGENFGEAFLGGDSDTYTGYATAGEDAPWDVDPGNSGNQSLGGNASN